MAAAAQIASVHDRWMAHRQVLEKSGIGSNHVAAAMLVYYAAFHDALQASLEVAEIESDDEGARALVRLFHECRAMCTLAAAAQGHQPEGGH